MCVKAQCCIAKDVRNNCVGKSKGYSINTHQMCHETFVHFVTGCNIAFHIFSFIVECRHKNDCGYNEVCIDQKCANLCEGKVCPNGHLCAMDDTGQQASCQGK